MFPVWLLLNDCKTFGKLLRKSFFYFFILKLLAVGHFTHFNFTKLNSFTGMFQRFSKVLRNLSKMFEHFRGSFLIECLWSQSFIFKDKNVGFLDDPHCVKSVRIWNYSDPYFSTFYIFEIVSVPNFSLNWEFWIFRRN